MVGLKEIDQGVCITVEDNGIGVEKSKEQNKQSKNNHQSYGSKILGERIDILNYNQIKKIRFGLSNLNKKGINSGTCATLFIPFSIIKNLTPKIAHSFPNYEKN